MASKTIRKTALAAAIALTAAAPSFAASAPSEWAGYPSSDAVQFQPQPASLATTAAITATPTEVIVVPLDTADTADAGAVESAPAPAAMAQAPADTSSTATPDLGTWAPTPETTQTVTVTTAIAAPATLPQWEQPPITRESVRAELLAARQAGTLTPTNEVGDTDRVLAARQAFNDEQSDAIVAEYQAEYDRQVAMQEAEIRRAAIEADWLQYGVAQSPTGYEDPTAEVQIDVISMQPLGIGE